MSSFTPGPWSVEQNTYGSIVCKDGKSMIAVWPEDLGGQSFPHEANARLIAASPRMYSYVESRADAGDEEAKRIIAEVSGA